MDAILPAGSKPRDTTTCNRVRRDDGDRPRRRLGADVRRRHLRVRRAVAIDVQGKIALVRYSVPYSYRGFKALTAQRRGLAGILIYSDPADDGYGKGKTYPAGPWGPESHIQRGGIPFDFLVPGDPLTP